MPETSESSLFQEQRKSKPKIEDVDFVTLNAEKKQSLLDVSAWLRANKLSPTWSSANSWKVSYKGKGVCYIKVPYGGPDVGSWSVAPETGRLGDANTLPDERLKDIVWDNIKYCRNCAGCRPGRRVVVCGREFDRVCNSAVTFYDPNAEEIECIKVLIQTICDMIRSGNALATGHSGPDPAVVAKQQKNAKIEDYFPQCLEGNMLKTSQDFIAYLQMNKMMPKFSIWNWWEASYKGLICSIRLSYTWQKHLYSWAVGIYLNHMDEYAEEIISEGLQHIIWDHIIPCKGCAPNCAPGTDLTVLGKECKGVCVYCPPTPIWVYDPDEATINGIQKLLVLEKKARDENAKKSK